jgi:cell fate (sporulation/competence/biofilm development) regulator YmcA (YheA/YmcA/DUF963 family)
MKDILDLVQQRKEEFARLPLFKYLQDTSIHPRQRLAFAPALSPLVLGFGELCKRVLKEEPTNDTLQALINIHTYEEDIHWQWFLEDLPTLGFDDSLLFTNTLKFLWGEETKKTRQVCAKMERYAYKSDPVMRLIVMEVAEAAANVFFSETEQVINELKSITKKQYLYFGGYHIEKENNHHIKKEDITNYLEQIPLVEERRQECYEVVDILFKAFTESMDELLVYSQRHQYIELMLQAA